MEKFKATHPDYFKKYYLQNKDKILKRNKQNYHDKKIYYTIQIAGTTYCFEHKKDIVIKKCTQKQLDKNGNYIRVFS